jgi:hypothetical protein
MNYIMFAMLNTPEKGELSTLQILLLFNSQQKKGQWHLTAQLMIYMRKKTDPGQFVIFFHSFVRINYRAGCLTIIITIKSAVVQ